MASPALLDKYAQAAKDAGLTRELFSVYLGASIVLQPKQLQFAAACAMCDHSGGPVEIGFGGARGGGKSHAGLAVLAADCLRFDGLTCLLLRKVGKANRENFNELRLKVLRGVHTVWKQQEGILLFDNGSKIILGHFQNENDIDAYLGLEYDVILVEEATTLTSPKYRAIRTCNRSSKPGWRPRMYSTTNPGGVGHTWYKLRFIAPYKSGKQTSTRFIASTVEDNACVNTEYRDNLGSLTGWQKRAWLHGDWDIAAGQFFTSWKASVHVLPASKMPKFIRGIHRPWASLDYGYTHYTTAYPFLKEDGDLFILDEHAERRWLPVRHAPAIHTMLERQGMTVADLATFTAGHDVFAQKGDERAKTIADQYKELDIFLKAAKIDRITGASELLQRLGEPDGDPLNPDSGYIRPTIYISERCVRLIECIPALEHDPHRPEDVLKVDTDDDGLGGDDSYDGARYGWMEAALGDGWALMEKLYGQEEVHDSERFDREQSDHDNSWGHRYPLEPDYTIATDGLTTGW
ncbi:terminase large subunit domain-containing protein [Armatimonas sp.]|uniref:terminase large subunit domain-containing protein n=1 Tax=Armatimonas sp. TaxID=1872638 RepID=UPI00374CD5AA